MTAMALSRAAARAVESDPGGQDLDTGRGGGWKRCRTRARRKG
jgi:hypothetical protein